VAHSSKGGDISRSNGDRITGTREREFPVNEARERVRGFLDDMQEVFGREREVLMEGA